MVSPGGDLGRLAADVEKCRGSRLEPLAKALGFLGLVSFFLLSSLGLLSFRLLSLGLLLTVFHGLLHALLISALAFAKRHVLARALVLSPQPDRSNSGILRG